MLLVTDIAGISTEAPKPTLSTVYELMLAIYNEPPTTATLWGLFILSLLIDALTPSKVPSSLKPTLTTVFPPLVIGIYKLPELSISGFPNST